MASETQENVISFNDIADNEGLFGLVFDRTESGPTLEIWVSDQGDGDKDKVCRLTPQQLSRLKAIKFELKHQDGTSCTVCVTPNAKGELDVLLDQADGQDLMKDASGDLFIPESCRVVSASLTHKTPDEMRTTNNSPAR